MIKLTNGGKPHICGTIQIHNNGLKDNIRLCNKCMMPVDKKIMKKKQPISKDNIFIRVRKDTRKRLNIAKAKMELPDFDTLINVLLDK